MNLFFKLLLLFFFASCLTLDQKDSLESQYRLAIKDAEIAEAKEISNNLIAIRPENKRLSWKKIGKDRYVKMLTWTSWNGYDSQKGKEISNSREIWVTAFPELKDFCKKLDSSSNTFSLRLEQLLGLPPNNGKTRIVEFWVKPDDLFRPSPDPEIYDSVAELDFPATASDTHKDWVKNLQKNSYGSNGYPWTRLGYTYDWGNPNSKVGLSEFVIRKDAKVTVDSVADTKEYCK